MNLYDFIYILVIIFLCFEYSRKGKKYDSLFNLFLQKKNQKQTKTKTKQTNKQKKCWIWSYPTEEERQC